VTGDIDDPKFAMSGGFGGGQFGYNRQYHQLLYGLGVDLQGAGISGSGKLGGGGGNTAAAEANLGWFGTIQGRLGYSFDNALLYAAGGFAFGGVEEKVSFSDPIAFPPNSSTVKRSQTEMGYAVGGGLEYRLNPAWSAKLEYQYIDIGGDKLSTIPLATKESASAKFDATYNTVRVGLNYHLQEAPGPLK
jgi:outer membrane immunogenic protein